jgi:hypothetical protein
MKERWQKHLTDNRCEHNGILVLKSEFNMAWNYFSAKELGDTVLGYWRSWLATAESGTYSTRYPMFTRDCGDLAGTDAALSIVVGTPTGPLPIPDVRKIDLAQKVIVSRK